MSAWKKLVNRVKVMAVVASSVIVMGVGAMTPVVANVLWGQPASASEGGASGGGGVPGGGMSGGDASGSHQVNVDTSILDSDMDIMGILELVLKILVYGLGVAATLGVIIAGIMYMTARDNEQQVAQAKKRLIEIVIGLVAWALMFALLNWLIPGGMSF